MAKNHGKKMGADVRKVPEGDPAERASAKKKKKDAKSAEMGSAAQQVLKLRDARRMFAITRR
jgi:hypothetical protein